MRRVRWQCLFVIKNVLDFRYGHTFFLPQLLWKCSTFAIWKINCGSANVEHQMWKSSTVGMYFGIFFTWTEDTLWTPSEHHQNVHNAIRNVFFALRGNIVSLHHHRSQIIWPMSVSQNRFSFVSRPFRRRIWRPCCLEINSNPSWAPTVGQKRQKQGN